MERSKSRRWHPFFFGAGVQAIIGRFHSDEKLVPCNMSARGGRSSSAKRLIQQTEFRDLIHLRREPVGKRAAAGAANLIPQQLERAVAYSMIVRLNNTFFMVIDEPNQAPLLDRHPEQRMWLQNHLTIILPHIHNARPAATANGSSRASTRTAMLPTPPHAAAIPPDTQTNSPG